MADLNGAAIWIDELNEIAANAQLQQFAHSPNSSADQVFELISGVARNALPEMAKNFLRTVIANGRLSA